MAKSQPEARFRNVETERTNITLRFSGGNADSGTLDLHKYALTLQGWSDYFRLTGGLYQNALVDEHGERISTSINIRAVAEAKGSYELILGIVLGKAIDGIIGSRSDALVVWTFGRLLKWYKDFFLTYKKTKSRTTNVEEIIAALEALSNTEHISLNPRTNDGLVQALVESLPPSVDNDEDIEHDAVSDEFSAKRLLIEKIDIAAQNATNLLGNDCRLIELIAADGTIAFSLDHDDYTAIHRTLTLPPPDGIWRQVKVRFERINVKTGMALVYLEVDGQLSRSTNHVKIVDPAIRNPPNIYTGAFDQGAVLQLWAQRVRAEKGRLNLMWEITAGPPAQLSLYGPPDTRA